MKQELERRAEAGEMHEQMTDEAKYLPDWAEETFPDEKRIKGEHMKEGIDFEKIKSKILGK